MRSSQDPNYLEMLSRLRRARENAGFSQSELAKLLGKPQSYISKIESCERRIDLIETLELCKVLHINLAAIIPAEFSILLK